MKSFRKFFWAVIVSALAILAAANLFLWGQETHNGSPYRVEIGRLARAIEADGLAHISLSDCLYVTDVVLCEGQFPDAAFYEDTDADYQIRVVGGKTYRFDYIYQAKEERQRLAAGVNLFLAAMVLLLLCAMFFVRNGILKPFEILSGMPYELSRGNLTVPVKESKSRFFGRFVWGMNVLRENLEQHRQSELALQREKKTLVISLSHDIKTPLSAIKLYAKALSKGLYREGEKQLEIAASIGAKADEIEKYLGQIIEASSQDFLNLQAEQGEFYLSELVREVCGYYREKLQLMKIGFSVGEYSDCIVKGDLDRSVEVLQNIIENAVKYGDGQNIALSFSEEEGCSLVTVENTGCTLPQAELPHIFESFIRGTNAENENGSGLGLYICRQLMHKMQGDIFAEIKGGRMHVTVIFLMV